jgi:hypothetical protein
MLESNSGDSGSGTGGTGRRRSTFYVNLSENMTANSGTNSLESRESMDKTSSTKTSPSKRPSNASQTPTLVEPEKNSVSRKASASKQSSQVLPSRTPSKTSQTSSRVGSKPSPVHAQQPLKACTRTIQGPQLLKIAPPRSPKPPKKSSSLLQLSSIKSPESSSSPHKTGAKPLQLSLSLRRTPSTKGTVPVTPRDNAKSSVRNVSVSTKSVSSAAPPTDGPKQIPVTVVHQHDRGKDAKTVYNKQEEAQPSGRVNKNVSEDDANDAGVHSGKW